MKAWSLILLCSMAFASVGKKHDNTLGYVQNDNPYTYVAGAITDAALVEEGKGVTLRVQPLATYQLFTEDILFCPENMNLFENKSNPMLLTYETVAHRSVGGIGCHHLVRVDEIVPRKELP